MSASGPSGPLVFFCELLLIANLTIENLLSRYLKIYYDYEFQI